MSLEDLGGLDISDGIGSASEGAPEVSEKFREAVKRGAAAVKGTKKDQAKAKKYDLMLARFLVTLIISKKYDTLLGRLFKAFDEGFGSNFLLGILSLIHNPIGQEIRSYVKAEIFTGEIPVQTPKGEFDDSVMVGPMRERINFWVEDIRTVLVLDSSVIVSEKMLKIIDDSETIIPFVTGVFRFFLYEKGYLISENQANHYSDFLISEIKKTLKGEFE